jgi:2TM domain-containing protein
VARQEVEAVTVQEDAGRPGLRAQAIARLRKRRDFGVHPLVYLLVNGSLVLIWAMTDPNGFFWPTFPIAFWGIGVVLHAWDVFRRAGFSEEQIDREMKHLQDAR